MEFSNRRPKRLPEVPIIPMIDTMFFLLVFFILTALNVIKVSGINVNLPDAKNSQPTKSNPDLSVSIKADQSIYVNDKKVPPGQDIGPVLLSVLKKQVGANPDLTKESVIINADGSVPHRLVVQCIDQSRGVHINKFSIATVDDKSATGKK